MMKKLNNLTHILLFVFVISNMLTSCGTEEEVGDEQLTITLSSTSVPIGSNITFTSNSNVAGDVTAETTFFVNGTPIEGNTFVPTEVNENNEVYAEFNGLTSEVKTFSSTEVTPSQYTQKVLFEDYTGTWCGYCPRMNTIVHYMTEYSENVIPVAIHVPGSPTDPWLYEYASDMMSTSNYNISGAPAGMINRSHHFNDLPLQYPCPNTADAYYSQINPYLNQAAPLGLAINSTLNGNNLNINVKVGFAADNIPDARLVVNLVEDGLIHYQYNYFSGSGASCDPEFDYANMPQPIPNFEHNHVLLKSYTDIYGDQIPIEQISNGSVWSRDFEVSLPSNVTNSNNLTIVAFVLGNGDQVSNREVINVQSAPVGTNQDFD